MTVLASTWAWSCCTMGIASMLMLSQQSRLSWTQHGRPVACNAALMHTHAAPRLLNLQPNTNNGRFPPWEPSAASNVARKIGCDAHVRSHAHHLTVRLALIAISSVSVGSAPIPRAELRRSLADNRPVNCYKSDRSNKRLEWEHVDGESIAQLAKNPDDL